MKKFKKLFAVLLSLVMLLIMAMPAFAADPATYTITINNATEGHTYQVYQIFTGDVYNDPVKGVILSNAKWGTGIDGKTVGEDATAAAAELEGYTGTAAEKVARFMQGKTLGAVYGTLTYTGNKYSLSGLPAGYYLVKDEDASLNGKDDAYTQYIFQVVQNVAVDPKSAKPTVDKQVYDNNDGVLSGDNDGWGESADHAINKSFQFKLTATLPADTDFLAYKTYKLVFNDTMSAGVTFESIASVTVGGTDVPVMNPDNTNNGYIATATSGQAGGSWSLTIKDIKPYMPAGYDGTTAVNVEVIYNAHLNENAVVNTASGTTENKNTVSLQYSNNPNVSGTGSGTPGNEDLGKTPEDSVWVFTYGVNNTKVDASDSGNKIPLAGAGFRLYDSTGNTEIGLIYDAGRSAYRPVKAGETAEEMKSADATGKFNIIGLDAGKYVLKETTVPKGYNKCADVAVEIKASHSENGAGTEANVNLEGSSQMNNEIENKRGAILPTTGGMGTTIFYVLGGLMVIGAVVILVTRRRMGDE